MFKWFFGKLKSVSTKEISYQFEAYIIYEGNGKVVRKKTVPGMDKAGACPVSSRK